MPLITLCGYPASGKSTRAEDLCSQLKAYIAKNQLDFTCTIIQETDKSVYSNSNDEKKCRADLISQVERTLSKKNIVILDGLNYIKGFRYQLYCIAKTLNTPSCVLYCAASLQDIKSFHQGEYGSKVLDELVMRFEEPNGMNRWDKPLFTLLPRDELKDCFESICQLLHGQAPKPNMSTIVKPLTEPNYVYQLNQITQEIMDSILQQQNGAGSITVPWSKQQVSLSQSVSLMQLRRIRRQFIQVNKIHTLIGQEQIAEGFVTFLNSSL